MIGESGTFRVRPILKLKMGKLSKGFFGEPLKHVITHMWAIHGKQKIVDKR